MGQPSHNSLRQRGYVEVHEARIHAFLEQSSGLTHFSVMQRLLSGEYRGYSRDRAQHLRVFYGVEKSGTKSFAPRHVLDAYDFVNGLIVDFDTRAWEARRGLNAQSPAQYAAAAPAIPKCPLTNAHPCRAATRANWVGATFLEALRTSFDLGGEVAVAALIDRSPPP